jgi:UDP-2,3-diacylglucosamine hydrolase
MTPLEFIASDIHLGAVARETEHRFVAFLDHVGEHGSGLLLAGDLFDFWFEYGEVIPGRHFRVLAALARLVEAGIPVTLAGGNHDAWGGRFLREEVGVAFHDKPFRISIAGRTALVAHGDGLGKGDFKYRALKAMIRSRAAIATFRALHPELGLRLAHAVSSTETRTSPDPRQVGRARFIENWARQQLVADPSLAWVVCGHAHVPACVEVDPGRFYLNAGDWLTHFTYITIDATANPELRTWAGANGSRPEGRATETSG